MADNVTVDNGALTDYVVASDERTIAATAVEVQRVAPLGAPLIANGHVTVSSTAGNIVASRDTRHRVVIVNYQTVPIYVGVATVTTSTGLRLDSGASLTLYTTAAVQGITSAAYTAAGEDDKVHYIEEYD